ncbi:MAG: hypothetical protein Pars2KO_06880 [Parasphingorhabdus sp.]
MNDEQGSNPSRDPSESRTAGGFYIAVGTVAGAIVGALLGQASIGFLAGLALGSLLALIIWLKER